MPAWRSLKLIHRTGFPNRRSDSNWVRFAKKPFRPRVRCRPKRLRLNMFATLVVMSSPRQIDANRGNGRRSNGPKTGAGKASSSKNAMKHGLLSKDILLPGEVAEAFDDLAAGIRADFRPVGR